MRDRRTVAHIRRCATPLRRLGASPQRRCRGAPLNVATVSGSSGVQHMGVITWIVAGALLGGAASMLSGSRDRRGFAVNVATGIAGVMFGGWLVGKLIGATAFEPGEFSLGGLLVSLLGAAVLLGVLHRFRGIRHQGERTGMKRSPGNQGRSALASHVRARGYPPARRSLRIYASDAAAVGSGPGYACAGHGVDVAARPARDRWRCTCPLLTACSTSCLAMRGPGFLGECEPVSLAFGTVLCERDRSDSRRLFPAERVLVARGHGRQSSAPRDCADRQ